MNKKLINLLAFYSALLIGLIVLVAAFGKIFYPSEILIYLDRGTGLFEIFLICSLLFFYHQWKIWFVLVPIFALWGGYALFWLIWGLPCGCLGKLVHLPKGFSLFADLIFFTIALIFSYLLKGGKKIFIAIGLACLTAPIGYFFAYHIHRFLTNVINNLPC